MVFDSKYFGCLLVEQNNHYKLWLYCKLQSLRSFYKSSNYFYVFLGKTCLKSQKKASLSLETIWNHFLINLPHIMASGNNRFLTRRRRVDTVYVFSVSALQLDMYRSVIRHQLKSARYIGYDEHNSCFIRNKVLFLWWTSIECLHSQSFH